MVTETFQNPTTMTYPITRPWHTRLAKRALDIFASALGLLILWPLFVFVAIRIKRDSPGPVFFRGPRMGRAGASSRFSNSAR
jgi:lipopolysaccharide/colanic/teichoic acid biosynthesis glycosyltransferase